MQENKISCTRIQSKQTENMNNFQFRFKQNYRNFDNSF